MSDLAKLPNIGDALAGKLSSAGIRSREALVELGSVQAALRIGEGDRTACYSTLLALEGAIRGVRWHSIPASERAWLKESFDEARRRPRPGLDDSA